MGSRAVVVVCRDADAARRASASGSTAAGAMLHPHRPAASSTTRTGAAAARPLRDAVDARRAVGRARHRLAAARLRADAVVGQGAGAAADASTRRSAPRPRPRCRLARDVARAGRRSGIDVGDPARAPRPSGAATRRAFVDAYRRYCWPVEAVDDLSSRRSTCSPARARAYLERDHRWHMEVAATRLATADPS